MTAMVFDLDGTLIDSVPDIHAAAIKMLTDEGRAPLSIDKIRSFIGHGVPALISKVMNEIDENPEDRARHAFLEQCFMRHYIAAPAVLSRPFDSVLPALEALSAKGFKLAVCTNKPEEIARQILRDIGMESYFRSVIGGDSLSVRKPDPAPLYAAIDRAGAKKAIYVGDSEVDSETALAANVPFVLFTEGYRKAPINDIHHHFAFRDFSQLQGIIETMLDQI